VKIFLGLFLILALVSPAQARLGETPEQVAGRFGKGEPSRRIAIGSAAGITEQEFNKQGFLIRVLFTNISVQETYLPSIPGHFVTDSQVRALLAANSQGHQWKQSGSDGGTQLWIRDDGAKAMLLGHFQFIFQSKFLIDKQEASKKEKLPSVEGF
jgi:hypothetical protein